MPEFDIKDLVRTAKEFERKLSKVKSQHRDAVKPGWYPYPTFANVPQLEKLLTGENRALSRLIGDRFVLDMGTGDGDLSFLLESLGVKVHAIDHPAINYNRMTGLHAAKEALHSSVDIQTLDLDAQFALAERVYGLVLLFGVLSHLTNPFYVMEALARQSEYCLMSTRIARVSPDRSVRFELLPVAYLVDERETNNDPTNFWIFTEPGLRRLLERAGWEILDFMTTGCKSDSDPVSADRDERAFCLLRSRATDFTRDVKLCEGWYDSEDGNFRWTQKSFSVTLGPLATQSAAQLSLFFYLPEIMIQQLGKVGLRATVNGTALEKHEYSTPGDQVYTERVPPDALGGTELRIEFTVDQPFSFGNDDRELGVLVSFARGRPILLTPS
jgi:tRNA (mo5U34)-methyltransferase